MKKYYHIALDINGKTCLVIGGGKIAARKVQGLLQSGAVVSVVSPDLNETLTSLYDEGQVQWIMGPFTPEYLQGAFLVIAATNCPQINNQVALAANQQGILINVVDVADLCDFILPAIRRQAGLVITTSTEGRSPLLARLIADEIIVKYGEYGALADLCGRLRPIVSKEPCAQRRRKFWEILMASQWRDLPQEDLITQVWKQVAKEIDGKNRD